MHDHECWLWLGKPHNGYGVFRVGTNYNWTTKRAHIYSWELHNGRAVKPGMLVCHTCDTPLCVNPQHLYEGTPKDNTRDMVKRGRNRNQWTKEGIA